LRSWVYGDGKLEIGDAISCRASFLKTVDPEQCQWDEPALKRVISDYTHEAGVRELERQIGRFAAGSCRDCSWRTAESGVTPEVVAVPWVLHASP
jgi:ATP-dependent Lon protease